MKAGLEVHVQLATGKLFCRCPAELTEEVRGTFVRSLRAVSGENRQVDVAARFEFERSHRFRYEMTGSDCLVEADEEPPLGLDEAALDAALRLASWLHARIVDEIQVMRKIVVDGSNTSGFQRTALVAVDGRLAVGGRDVSIPTICLEEDAARRIAQEGETVTYRLDRLGIPLIEISTGPELASGEELRLVAEEIGSLVRATGPVRRGLGSIREDVNVSIPGGSRVEIKGVQELRAVSTFADGEAARQRWLLSLRDALVARGTPPRPGSPVAVDGELADVETGPIRRALTSGGVVLAMALPGFAGRLGRSSDQPFWFGRELADHARGAGVGGIIHSDELPGHGITSVQVERLRRRLALDPPDAFVLVADRDRTRAERALERVRRRAEQAFEGVPGETRDPLPDGTTRFSRPLAGQERMYPETDIPPIALSDARIARAAAPRPKGAAEQRECLQREFGLPAEVARVLVADGEAPAFAELVRRGHEPAVVARLLTQDIAEAADGRERVPAFSLDVLSSLLEALRAGRFSKEGKPAVLRALLDGAPSVDAAIAAAGLTELSEHDLEAMVARIVATNRPLVEARGLDAFSPLMGDVMREARGRYDGERVAAALRAQLERSIRSARPGPPHG